MSITLRADQEVSVGGAREYMAAGRKRILIQAPCGFGKTVVGSYIMKSAATRGYRVMFLTHREELAKQASRTLTRIELEHSFVMAAFTMDPRARVHVAMIDTLRNRIKKLPPPDILLVDECHHAASETWRKIIMHYAESGAVVIGLSATPERLDGKGLSDIFEVMVPGPSPGDLIERGSLSRFRYLAPPSVLDLTGVKTLAGEFNSKDLAAATDKPAIIGDAIEHYVRELGGKRAIVFAVNLDHSKHVVEQFNARGIPAEHVDGEMPKDARAAAIKRFETGETLILSNVSLFGEGFDVAACDGVILLRATQSLALHIQMCGRALRPHASKEVAVILDHVGNVLRHGLPDENHEWSLEGRKKKPKGKKDDKEEVVDIQQCPKCYQVHRTASVCPHCGHIYETKPRGGLEQQDGELRELTADDRKVITELRKKAIKKARTLDELQRLGKEFGYAPGWAAATWKAKEKIRAQFAGRNLPPVSAYEADLEERRQRQRSIL